MIVDMLIEHNKYSACPPGDISVVGGLLTPLISQGTHVQAALILPKRHELWSLLRFPVFGIQIVVNT